MIVHTGKPIYIDRFGQEMDASLFSACVSYVRTSHRRISDNLFTIFQQKEVEERHEQNDHEDNEIH